MANLQLPAITVDTDSLPERNAENDPSTPSNQTADPQHLSPTSAVSHDAASLPPASRDGSLLFAGSSSRASTWDSVTLRERSISITSSNPTLVPPSRKSSSTPFDSFKPSYDDVPLSEALKPDPRYEKDFIVDDNVFAFSPGQLNKMLNPKSLAAFYALGGLEGLSIGLRTHLTAGLSLDETSLPGRVTFEAATRVLHSHDDKGKSIEPVAENGDDSNAAPSGEPYCDRIRVFGRNKLAERKTKGFLELFWAAYNDRIIMLLTGAAIISLSLGLYEALSGGSKVDWIEGVAIVVAILIVTLVTAANDWQKERQFAKLNRRVCYVTWPRRIDLS